MKLNVKYPFDTKHGLESNSLDAKCYKVYATKVAIDPVFLVYILMTWVPELNFHLMQ